MFRKIVLFFVGAALAVTAVAGEPESTQSFSPSRFALLSATVLVQASVSQEPLLNQQALFRIDTQTGKVCMLQAVVQSPSTPYIINAVWVPVTEISSSQLQWQMSLYQQPNISGQ